MAMRLYLFFTTLILIATGVGSSAMGVFANAQTVVPTLLPSAGQTAQGQNRSSQIAPSQILEVQGLAIDPFLIETDLTPGQASQYSITLTNVTDAPLIFETSINDFVTNGRDGQPLFLPSGQQSDPKYSLSTWVKVTQQPNFTIVPRGQTTINFTITPPLEAELGTHYGGLLFGQPLQQLGDQATAVQSKAGTIILARLGKANEQGTISNFFSQRKVYQSAPINLALTFDNFGNVHTKPKGDIYIRNMFSRDVADLQVNRDALIVLPETERDFAATWQPRWAFGRYTAETVLYFGNPKLELRATTSFWVIPIVPLVAGLGIALVLIAGIYVMIKRYNRYIIKRAQK